MKRDLEDYLWDLTHTLHCAPECDRHFAPRDIIKTMLEAGLINNAKQAWRTLEKWSAKNRYNWGVSMDLGWREGVDAVCTWNDEYCAALTRTNGRLMKFGIPEVLVCYVDGPMHGQRSKAGVPLPGRIIFPVVPHRAIPGLSTGGFIGQVKYIIQRTVIHGDNAVATYKYVEKG